MFPGLSFFPCSTSSCVFIWTRRTSQSCPVAMKQLVGFVGDLRTESSTIRFDQTKANSNKECFLSLWLHKVKHFSLVRRKLMYRMLMFRFYSSCGQKQLLKCWTLPSGSNSELLTELPQVKLHIPGPSELEYHLKTSLNLCSKYAVPKNKWQYISIQVNDHRNILGMRSFRDHFIPIAAVKH